MTLLDPSELRTFSLAQDGDTLALESVEGSGPTIVWLPGYGSDMHGTKATWLTRECRIWGWRLLKFDYRGCGRSTGVLRDQTLSTWLADTLAAIDATPGPLILVGSSMGAWLALRAATQRPDRVAALALLAPAPDFTESYWNACTPAMRAEAERTSQLPLDRERPLSLRLVQDGNANHLLLQGPIHYTGPTAILHGLRDTIADPAKARLVADRLAGTEVTLTLIKDGDHSLSRPQDLTLLWQTLARLRERILSTDTV